MDNKIFFLNKIRSYKKRKVKDNSYLSYMKGIINGHKENKILLFPLHKVIEREKRKEKIKRQIVHMEALLNRYDKNEKSRNKVMHDTKHITKAFFKFLKQITKCKRHIGSKTKPELKPPI